MGQVDEMINFGGQEVEVQGHTTPKLDLDTWQRIHSRPLRSTRFSSFTKMHHVYFLLNLEDLSLFS